MRIIAEALSKAWTDLLRTQRKLLLSAQEAELNALMVTRLNSLLDEDVGWSVLVRSVTRGSETSSFDGSHLEKRPDISLHLTARNPSFALIVECKLVDHPRGRRTDMYCNDGLARFIRGEYAWASREAFMLAYVRDGSRIDTSLTPHLSECRKQNPDPFETSVLPEMVVSVQLHLARSRHRRSFRYVGRSSSNKPGPICIWHLWILPR